MNIHWRSKPNMPGSNTPTVSLAPGSTSAFRIVVFVRAVGRHWAVLLAGGVLLGGIATWQRIGHVVKPWLYWSVATIALFIAFVRAWNDQVDAAEQIGSELVILQSRVEKLERPADRPMLSFLRWVKMQIRYVTQCRSTDFTYGITERPHWRFRSNLSA